MLPREANLTVERQRATTSTDGHGNDVRDWTTPTVLTIGGCWIGSASAGVEYRADRQTTVSDEVWWGPPDADVEPTDRIKALDTGVVYEVNGPVTYLRGFSGLLAHKTCLLQVITQ